MSIATKCTCGSSLNGICNWSKDCPQLVTNMEKKYPIGEHPTSSYQPIFDHMHQEHGLTLLESEMADIIHVVERMGEGKPQPQVLPLKELTPEQLAVMNKKVEVIGGIPAKDHKKCHDELRRDFGKATKCEMENCISVNPKRFEWAKRKDRSYTSNPEDYIQLCPSCHRKYDFNEEIRGKLKKKKQGENNNNSKLTNLQVLDIVALITKGDSNKGIALIYNVHPAIISNIKTGKRWGTVTGINRVHESGQSQPGREEWISVDDRLPTEGGRYWCYVEEITDLGRGYFQWNCAYNQNGKLFTDKSLCNGERITYWRPLPEAPKRGEGKT